MIVTRFLLVLVAALALPQIASAATVSAVSDEGPPQAWRYVAGKGETNNLTITTTAGSATLHDTAGITPGDGCSAIDSQTVTCNAASGSARLEDGNDRAVAKGPAPVTLYGGDGNDVLTGGDGGDYLQGDFGNDSITGGKGGDQIAAKDGNDKVFAADGGPDIVQCSRGIDHVVLDRVDQYKACEKRKLKGKRFSTISAQIGSGFLDSEQLDNGDMESFFTVNCRLLNAKCDAGAQIVGSDGGVIANSITDSKGIGYASLDFRYSRAAVGSPPGSATLPVQVKLTVKQKGKTERRTIPLVLSIGPPQSGGG
jgi:Ca2+-binding RTX toxin-like protein